MGICRKIKACVQNISINGVETTFEIKGDYLVSGVVKAVLQTSSTTSQNRMGASVMA